MPIFNREKAKQAGFTDDQINSYIQTHPNGPTSQEDMSSIQQRLQELSQPSVSQEQPQGDFMSRLLQSRTIPLVGAVTGGSIGSLAGPVTGILGAGAGYAGGDVIRKTASSMLGKRGKQSELTPESVGETAKGAGSAVAGQAIGQTAAYALKFIKPGTVTSLLGTLTDKLSKKAGFGNISREALELRFMDEVIPKALRFSETQGEDVVRAGEKLIEQKIKPTKVFDAEELNFLRKNLNAIGEGAEGMKEALINGLAKIVREEQLKRAPLAQVSLPAERGIRELVKGMRAFWPTRMGLMISDALRSVSSGIGSSFAKYGGGALLGGLSQKEK